MSSMEDHVKTIVDAAPPLSDGQRERIGALLRPRLTLADVPPPDEATARRLLAIFASAEPPTISEPLEIEVKP